MPRRIIISERQLERLTGKPQLNEGLSKVLYHFCSLYSCLNILRYDKFLLTLSSNNSDSYDRKRLFYFSTQRSRSKDLGYAGHLGTCVRIQLNGDLLSQNYSGRPVDYWGNSMGKPSYYREEMSGTYGKGFSDAKRFHHNFEMEDRIVSYKPYIENASKYISTIDIYVDEKRKDDEYRKKDVNLVKLIREMVGKYIPVRIYTSLKDFNSMTQNTADNSEEFKGNFYDEWPETVPYDYNNTELGMYDRMSRRPNVNLLSILVELANVLTDGKCEGMHHIKEAQKYYGTIRQAFEKFGLGNYTTKVINTLASRWGSSVPESCNLLSSTVNTPVRKFNSENPHFPLANNVMELAAWILRQKGASNFNELAWKFKRN